MLWKVHNLIQTEFIPAITGAQASRSQMFFRIGVLKIFTIFLGKHLCWTVFLIKLLKRHSNTSVFCEHWDIFKNIFFYRTLPMAASTGEITCYETERTLLSLPPKVSGFYSSVFTSISGQGQIKEAWEEGNRWSHPLCTYTKFSEKLKFLTSWYTHVRVPISGLEMLDFRKRLRTYLMDDPNIEVVRKKFPK